MIVWTEKHESCKIKGMATNEKHSFINFNFDQNWKFNVLIFCVISFDNLE